MACPFGPETTAHAEHAALDECIPYATEHLFRSAEVVVSSDHDDPPSHPVERISDVDAAHVNTGGDSKDVLLLGPFGHGVANDSVSGGSDPVVTSLIDVPCPLGRYRARETVVSSVKSESVSADRRSITRQNRSTARSARRRFSSSADGVGETVLLGEGDEMGGIGETLGWELGLVQPVRKAAMLPVRTHAASRVCTAHLPSVLHPPKGSFGPWRSKHQWMLDDAIGIPR